MYMLARVFQALAEKRPDIDAGVFAYAKAGFGDYVGFLSAFGYWLGSCLGNTFYWVLIASTLGRFFPEIFGDGTNPTSITGANYKAQANYKADCDFNLAALHPAYPIKCRTSTQRTQAPESVDNRKAPPLTH